jgi:hypothetical protein
MPIHHRLSAVLVYVSHTACAEAQEMSRTAGGQPVMRTITYRASSTVMGRLGGRFQQDCVSSFTTGVAPEAASALPFTLLTPSTFLEARRGVRRFALHFRETIDLQSLQI